MTKGEAAHQCGRLEEIVNQYWRYVQLEVKRNNKKALLMIIKAMCLKISNWQVKIKQTKTQGKPL